MGAAQSIPVVAETVTFIDSGVKLVASGTCGLVGKILDDKDAKDSAKKFLKDAGKSWEEYSERNIIFAPIRAAAHCLADEEEKAKKVMKKMGKSVEQVVDSFPVVGHAKGVIHYIAGDREHGDECMKGATRTLAVVAAGAATGGFGGGLVLGGVAAASSGAAYDGLVTGIESAVKDKDCPYGLVASVKQAVESDKKRDGYGVVNSLINVGYTVGGDFAAGASAAKAAKKLNKASKQRQALKKKVGKKATNDVVDAAKKLEQVSQDVKGNNHVLTKVKDLKTGEKAYGVNRRCRREMRSNEYASKGKASGYNSKTNAHKGHVGEFSREAGILEKTANKMHMDIEPRVGNRALNTCAEHHAFNKLGTHGKQANIRTASVTSRNGNITAVKRCGNCVQYGELMGKVVTDGIDGMPVPTLQFVPDTSASAVTSAALCGAAAVAICAFCDEEKCSCGEDKCRCIKNH